jgi:hypothetical protein
MTENLKWKNIKLDFLSLRSYLFNNFRIKTHDIETYDIDVVTRPRRWRIIGSCGK